MGPPAETPSCLFCHRFLRLGVELDVGWTSKARLTLIAHHNHIRWYNPKLADFEWRKVPQTDEEALSMLDGSPYSPTCKDTYREWRNLGATITAALMRAGEAAKDEREDGNEEDDNC